MKHLKHIKDTGFSTPKGYFDALEDAVFDKIKDQDALQGVEKPGFSVPADYFDGVEDMVLGKLKPQQEAKVVSLFSKRRLMYLSGVAAAILIMFAVFIKGGTGELPEEFVETYILEEGVDAYDIASLLSDEDLVVDFTEESLSEESLEDYLNTIDIEDLIIE